MVNVKWVEILYEHDQSLTTGQQRHVTVGGGVADNGLLGDMGH